MGHFTELVTLPINDSTGKMSTSDLVWAAVGQWRDEEANRYDDARNGSGIRTKPMLAHQAQWYISEHDREVMDHSLVIPVITDIVTTVKNVKVTVSGDLLRCLAGDTHWSGYQDLRELLVKEHGDTVEKFEVIGFPKPRKASAAATEGKAITTYLVLSAGRVVDNGASQAEARQKAIDYVNANEKAMEVTVEAVISRDTGDKALVRVTRPVPEEATITVKLTLTGPAKGAQPSEYLVAFDYHS